MKMMAHWVMDGMEATAESSLSGGDYSLYISAAIEQHHLQESIFRPFKEIHLKPLKPLKPLLTH